MRIFSANDEDLPVGVPFILNDLAYPWNWLDLASEDDLKQHGITYREVADKLPVPDTISDRQFFQQLALADICTQDEALAAVKTGEMPTALSALVDKMEANQKFGASMIICGATIFERKHPLTEAIGGAYGWTDDQIDQFFRDASQL